MVVWVGEACPSCVGSAERTLPGAGRWAEDQRPAAGETGRARAARGQATPRAPLWRFSVLPVFTAEPLENGRMCMVPRGDWPGPLLP